MRQLHHLFEQMDACAQELESATQCEYEAIRNLDAEQIMLMAERRIISHQNLLQLEQQCRTLLAESGMDDRQSLEVILDLNEDQQAADFQALRRKLYERIMRIDQRTRDNRLRLHAAYNVSSTILQHLGLFQPRQTYNRRANK